MFENFTSNELSLYIAIPFLSAFVGWATNWFGIKMMMYPANFVGIGFIGWQGIVPRMRVRLVKMIMENSIALVCTPKEMLTAIDEAKTIEQISEIIYPHMELWLDGILIDEFGTLWEIAPRRAKKEVYRALKTHMPEIAKGVLEEIKRRADTYIDIPEIAAQEAKRNPGILTELVMDIAATEIRFIILSGIVFGIPLGIIQAVTWYYYDNSFILPVFGLLVGSLTNYIALQMLMFPANPVNILGFKVQGLFLSRQEKVSADFADAFTKNFLEVGEVVQYVWNGKYHYEIKAVVNRKMQKAINKKFLSSVVYKALKIRGRVRISPEIQDSIQEKMLMSLEEPEVSQKLLEPINVLVAERMKNLTPEQFQGLLLPIFEQDKWLLVAVGGFLGFCAGTLQLIYLFGGSL